MNAVLVIGPELAADPQWAALQPRFAARGVATAVAEALTPAALLAAAAGRHPAWLATRRAEATTAAQTAGYTGIVIIGAAGESREAGVSVRYAPTLAELPYALVPRGGGCWHAG